MAFMLITFEGLDNFGKTTLVNKIKDYYLGLGVNVEISKEFETNIGIELKKMAIAGTLDPILKTFLFATDRYIRMKNISKDELNNKIILFDRYVPSAIAYRTAESVNKDWVESINSIFPKTDFGFFIDITPTESIKRNTDEKFNIKSSPEYLEKVREAYLSILDENKLIYINGMQSLDNIFDEVITKIEEYIKNNGKRI
jgi:dTMP kinase